MCCPSEGYSLGQFCLPQQGDQKDSCFQNDEINQGKFQMENGGLRREVITFEKFNVYILGSQVTMTLSFNSMPRDKTFRDSRALLVAQLRADSPINQGRAQLPWLPYVSKKTLGEIGQVDWSHMLIYYSMAFGCSLRKTKDAPKKHCFR